MNDVDPVLQVADEELPFRTLVCPITPQGLETPYAEGVASLTMRLADEHCVSVADFVGRQLAAVPNPYGDLISPKSQPRGPGSHCFHAWQICPNGMSDRTTKLVFALETVTGCHDLDRLTLLPLRRVLTVAMNKRRFWCPHCLDEWQSSRQPIYEPLVWTLGDCRLCPKHLTTLVSHCPECKLSQVSLGTCSRRGYCGHCGTWLGATLFTLAEATAPSGPEFDEAKWRCQEIRDIVALLWTIDPMSIRRIFQDNLRIYCDELHAGSTHDFAAHIQMARTPLVSWMNGSTGATLEGLLRVAKKLHIPSSSFFEEGGARLHLESARHSLDGSQQRNSAPYRTTEEMRAHIGAEISSEDPRSVADLAKSLGYCSSERLYQVEKDMCKQLTERFRKCGKSHRWKRKNAKRIRDPKDIESILQESIASPNPTSVKTIARQMGYANGGYILNRFPKECKALKAKITDREKGRIDRMGEACKAALSENPVPSLAEIARRLGVSTSTVLSANFPKVCQQIKEKRKAARSQKGADLKTRASVLLSEYPPLSALEACDRLGISLWMMESKIPEMRAKFTEGASAYRRELAAKRRERLDRAVLKAFQEIVDEGEVPSQQIVLTRLPEGIRPEWIAFRKAYVSAKNSIAKVNGDDAEEISSSPAGITEYIEIGVDAAGESRPRI